jgi:hypothetical protein
LSFGNHCKIKYKNEWKDDVKMDLGKWNMRCGLGSSGCHDMALWFSLVDSVMELRLT